MDTDMLSDEKLDELLSLAGESRPVSRAALDDESVRSVLDDAWHRAEINAARPETLGRARRPVYRRPLATAGMAAMVVGVASLVGVEGFSGGSGGAGFSLAVSPAAAAQLNRVAHVAAAQPGLSAGQWEYVERIAQTPTGSGSGTELVQDWFSANGVQRERVSLSGVVTRDQLKTPHEESAATAGVNLAAPPSDVQTLLSDIAGSTLFKNASPADDPGGYWTDLGNVLVSSTSPQLRSVAFTALKYLPGVTVLANQTDQLGRAGTALSLTDSGETETIIVSPSTGELLESYDTTTRAGVVYGTPAGAVVNRIIYRGQTVVTSDTALPGGGTQPLTSSEATTTTPVAAYNPSTSVQSLTQPFVPSATPPGATATATTPSTTSAPGTTTR